MKTPHENISEELLARYLAETANKDEINQIETWRDQSLANKHELEAYRIIWEQTGSLHRKKVSVNTDLAWNKVKLKMENQKINSSELADSNQIKNISLKPRKIQWKLSVTMWAAAVVALLIMAFGWHFIRTETAATQSLQLATTHNTVEKILPDGTKVFLNYNSTLTYPEEFIGDSRSVSLRGEAFFDVRPDAEHPFIIDANGTQVKVLGTSFNVKAYAKQPVRVDVATGKVLVKKANNELQLTKGESAEVSNDTVKSTVPDLNIMGYRTQVFDFNAADLKDVVSSIRNGYHIDLRLSNTQIAQCRLTIRFEKEPVDATLYVIAETLDLKVRKEGETYWLDGNSCQ